MLYQRSEKEIEVYLSDAEIDVVAQIVLTFVTKRGGNINPTLVAERPLPAQPPASGYTAVKDTLVFLGNDPDQIYRRLDVELPSGETITLCPRATCRPLSSANCVIVIFMSSMQPSWRHYGYWSI